MDIVSILAICFLTGGILFFGYGHQLKKNAEIKCGIVVKVLPRTKRLATIWKNGEGSTWSTPVTIEIEEDNTKKQFTYRPKSSFFNAKWSEVVEFYRIPLKEGEYRYIALPGYYYYSMLLWGLAGILALGLLIR